jgi:DNA-binding response OmpR family regulator
MTATAPAPAALAAPYIVMVDDEDDLREPVAEYLREQSIEVEEANGGPALDAILARRTPQLVVLDVTMPDEDGFSIARRLRANYGSIGIVMLTARRDVIDRVVGLELGADDYIMKPFEPRELLARIRSVLRRLSAAPADAPAGHANDEDGTTMRSRPRPPAAATRRNSGSPPRAARSACRSTASNGSRPPRTMRCSTRPSAAI